MEINWVDVAILFVSVCICLFIYVKWIFKYWERINVPYLKPSFPMGNIELPWRSKKGFNETMEDIYFQLKSKGYKHGGIFTFLRPVYVPIDLDLLKCIMIKDFQYFVDRGVYHSEKHDPLSAHLFSIEGDRWRHLRTKLSPTFTSGKMKAMFSLVTDCGKEMEDEIYKLYANKAPVDVKEFAALFTTNVIGTCAFGLECDCFKNPDNEFRYHTRRFFSGESISMFRRIAILSFPNLCKRLGAKVIPKDASKFFMDVTRRIIDFRESNELRRNDFIQLLLNINKEATQSAERLTFEQMAAQAFVFFLAGFETSSSTMTFTFYEIAKNQEIQDKMREEIHRVLEKHDGKLTYDAVMEMTYMSQVFDETLRKYPIVAILQRICTKDYKVPGENLVLKKGTKIMIPLKGLQNDPEYYPDPDKFDPERFSPENKAERHICAYIPFGEGPRNCIGMRFGIMQAKIGLAIMLKNYRYTLNSQTSPNMCLSKKSPLLALDGQVMLDIEKVY